MAKGMQRKKEVKKPKKEATSAKSTPALIESNRPTPRITEVMPKGKLKNKPQ